MDDQTHEPEPYDYLFKLLCIGEACVGKTTFLHQYVNDTFANFRSTIGIDLFEKYVTVKNDHRILLQLWDSAGQERYHSLTTSLFRNNMGFLLLFDITNESSFLSIRNWLTCIDTYGTVDTNLRPPVLLIGNKIDLVTHRFVDTMRAQQLADELGVSYIETSAVTGTNVQYALSLLIDQIFDFMEMSMEKCYPKPILQSLSLSTSILNDDKQKVKKSSSIKLMDKLNRVKKKVLSMFINVIYFHLFDL